MLQNIRKLESLFGFNIDSITVGLKSDKIVHDKVKTKYNDFVDVKTDNDNVIYFVSTYLYSHIEDAIDQINKKYGTKLNDKNIVKVMFYIKINATYLSSLYHKLLTKENINLYKTVLGSIVWKMNGNTLYIQQNGICGFELLNPDSDIIDEGVDTLNKYFLLPDDKLTITNNSKRELIII